MSLPAARVTDLVACPAFNVLVPHVGGPITMGEPTVLIGGLIAARMGDPNTCAGGPGAITTASPVVLIGGKMAARLSDLAGHGGIISPPCCINVLIGGPAPPPPPPPPPPPEPPPEEE